MSSEPTTLAPRLDAVDGLRGTAAIAVFAYHVWQFCGSPRLLLNADRLISCLHCAVDLFIVLSGLCLFWPYVTRPDAIRRWTLGSYLRRRFMRIAPPYYASIALLLLLPNVLVLGARALGKQASWQWPADLTQQLVTHLSFTHTLFPSTWDGLQGCYWTLGLEAQLYLAFIVILLAYRRIGMHVLWPVFACSIAYRLWIDSAFAERPWPIAFLFSVTFLGRWMQFGAGMLAAYLLSRLIQRGHRLTTFETAAGASFSVGSIVLGMTRVAWIPSMPPVFESTSYAIGFATLSLLAGAGAGWTLVLATRPIAAFGIMSYSFYLLHQNTAYYLSEGLEKVLGLNGAVEFAIMMTVGFACVLLTALVFFLAIERRCITPRTRQTLPSAEQSLSPSSPIIPAPI